MKPLATSLIAAALSCSVAFGASAATYDGFETYTPTTHLPGGSDGTGWTSNWAGNGVVTTQAIQLDDPGALIDGGDQAALIPGTSDNSIIRRSFTALTGTVYMSLLLRVENYGSDDFIIFQLTDGGTGDVDQSLSIGIRNQGGAFFARAGRSGGAGSQSVNSGTAVANSTDYLLLGVFNQNGGQYENVDFYLNPTDPTLATESPLVSATGSAPNMTQLSMFTVRTAVFNGDESVYFDELRISNNLADVFVPEPSSLALLGLGGFLIARRRRDT